MVRRSVADDSYGRGALSWSIELSEVNALPCAEHELAFMYRKRHIVTDEHRFDVRRGISFGMTVVAVLRNELCELVQQITLHVRVGILVHEDRRGGVRDVYHAYTFAHFRSCDRRSHARRHVDGRLALVGAERDLLVVDAHGTSIRSETIRAGKAEATLPPLLRTRLTRRRYFPHADVG